MSELRFTILGCGSSGGVPRLGAGGKAAEWGECDPAEPKNRRRRCAMLVERAGPGGITRVLIDTGPDLHDQLLDAGVGELDGVVYTHAHADHIHGIDDLRQVVFNMGGRRLPVWASPETCEALTARFSYVFTQAPGSSYPPILDMHCIDGPVRIAGAGGGIELRPLACLHGSIHTLGFRIGDLAYLPDVKEIPDETWPLLDGLEVWVLDALRRAPHPTHAHLDLALDWIARAAPARAVLTNMHVDLDFATLSAGLPPHIRPAHDGMVIAVRDRAGG